jgi:signal peptidase I
MAPTVPVNSEILVNTDYYDNHTVTRGDIIVFRPPPAAFASGASDLVKRVIGLPGETISSDASRDVRINGSVLSEPWLPAGTPLGPGIARTTIPAGDYYVLGDNRANSADSRFLGPISGSLIVGRVETSHAKVCPP